MLRKRIQLGLIHVAVAMTLVPINSTLNRVMIKELAISATLVAVMASLPYLLSPIQVAIGSYSDKNPIFGYRRTPYILLGLLLCVIGVAVAPQIAFLIADNFIIGVLVGILAFGAWGMGYNLTAVSYLSLASEISGPKGKGRTIAVMWFMMISGIILTAILVSRMVDPYTEAALMRAFTLVAGISLVIGILGTIRLEKRSEAFQTGEERYTWLETAQAVMERPQSKLFFGYLVILLAALLGQDILLEPFAAQAFDMTVRQTTRITSIWGVFVLIAISLAGFMESRIGKKRVASFGGWSALIGFIVIITSGFIASSNIFYVGLTFLGIGTGISTVSNLSLMLDMTVETKVGMYIGAWGVANAVSRLTGNILSGFGRDIVSGITGDPIMGYMVVFGILASFLLVSLFMLNKIDVNKFRSRIDATSPIERAAIAGD